MGLTFSLASFSCTGPLVGAALIAAASGQWFYPIISMLAFSATLALPFFFLALFPSTLSSLPKAGGWMNNMKVVLGFIVLATSLYFVNNAFLQWGGGLSREIFLSIWIAIFTLNTLYILGVFKFEIDSPIEKVGSIRIIFALIFSTLTFYLVSGLFGGNLGELETYVPQSENPMMSASVLPGGNSTPTVELTGWTENLEEGMAQAVKENKPVFLDFTGRTCTNCKKMDKKIFPLASIRELMDKMVKIKLITDVNEEPYLTYKKLQQDKYQSVAIPFYVLLTPDGQVIATESYNDDEEAFKAFLEKAL
jgi:thiol:disulfide interchange protein DsbD